VLANHGLLELPARVVRPRVYVCFIAILKLPFKFARHHHLQQAGKRHGDVLNGMIPEKWVSGFPARIMRKSELDGSRARGIEAA
jgi:hypothetical protein